MVAVMSEADLHACAVEENRFAITPASAVVVADPRVLFTNTKTQTYIAKAIIDTSFGQIRLINGYRGVQSDNLVDLDGSSVVAHFTQGTQDLKQYSTELQFTGPGFDDRLNFAAGLTYFREIGSASCRESVCQYV